MNELRHVGDYRLIERLGAGGAGEVFLATPTTEKEFAKVGELVAVKLYKERVLSEKNQLDRIHREFEVGSTITNPHLVHIYECNLSNPKEPYLVMEFVDGMPLSEWIKMFYPISEHLLLTILSRIANGLKFLHVAGIIHRDIKPENIMLSSDFTPKIMDFGVVKFKHIDGQTPSESFLGTIRNASPEWLRREEANDDIRTDLYSFGTVVYSLLHGHQVFHEEKQFARLVELVSKEVPRIDESLRNKPEPFPTLIKITETLLNKDPAKRYATIDEVIQLLAQARKSIPQTVVAPLHGYMATALTGVPDDAREAIAFKSSSIAGVCKQFEIYVYQPRMATDPLLHPDVDPELVYTRDRKRVLTADLIILIGDQPSLGVGQEIEIAGAFGIPAIIVRNANAKSKLSRMVSGSFLNVVEEVIYHTPEELAHQLRNCIANNLEKIRSMKQSARPNIPESIGASLRSMRQDAGLSIEEAATIVCASARLVKAVEERPLCYHNAGLHFIARLLSAYGKTASELFGVVNGLTGFQRGASDQNILRLEQVARSTGWPAADFLDLREDYHKSLVASGDTQMIPSDEWLKRHAALEKRKVQNDHVKTKATEQTELFGRKR